MKLLERFDEDARRFRSAHETYRERFNELRSVVEETEGLFRIAAESARETPEGRKSIAIAREAVLDNRVYTAMAREGDFDRQARALSKERDAVRHINAYRHEGEFRRVRRGLRPDLRIIRTASNRRDGLFEYTVTPSEESKAEIDRSLEEIRTLEILFSGTSGHGHLTSMIDTVTEHLGDLKAVRRRLEGFVKDLGDEDSRREALEGVDELGDRLQEYARMI